MIVRKCVMTPETDIVGIRRQMFSKLAPQGIEGRMITTDPLFSAVVSHPIADNKKRRSVFPTLMGH